MTEKDIRNIWIFIFFVIISGWIGVLVDSVLVAQPEVIHLVWEYG